MPSIATELYVLGDSLGEVLPEIYNVPSSVPKSIFEAGCKETELVYLLYWFGCL